jgi:hypothetical protein
VSLSRCLSKRNRMNKYTCATAAVRVISDGERYCSVDFLRRIERTSCIGGRAGSRCWSTDRKRIQSVSITVEQCRSIDARCRGHIPTARYFDQLQHATPTAWMPRGLPEASAFAEYLTSLGVSNDDHIVLYDRSASGLFAAARAWVLLKVRTLRDTFKDRRVRRSSTVQSICRFSTEVIKRGFAISIRPKRMRTRYRLMQRRNLPCR